MQNPFKEFLYFSPGRKARNTGFDYRHHSRLSLPGIFIYTKENTALSPMKQSGGRPLPWQNTNRSSHPYKKRNKNGTTDLILPLQNNRQPSPWSVSIPILPTPLLFADWDCPDGWRGTYSATVVKEGSSIRQKISGKYME